MPLALALAAGIALAPLVGARAAWTIALAAVPWAATLLVLERPTAAAAFLLTGVAAAGALRAMPLPLPPDHLARLDLPVTVRVEGTVAAEPRRFGPERTVVLIDVERADEVPRRGRLQLTLHGEPPPLTGGQRVRGPVALARPSGFRNPGVFDHAERLRRSGVHVTGSLRADRLLLLDDPRPAWNVRVRRALVGAMERALPPPSAALLAGLILGDRSNLPPDVDERFRASGVYHVLAVSGFNVALVGGSVLGVLLLARVGRRGAAAGAILAVVGFAAVVGPEPSVLRATVMAVLLLAALLLDREASALNSLGLAAVVVLAARPADLLDPGFQLSFAATLGIVLAPIPRHPLLAALGVTVAAQAAVMPIALVHFNQLATLAPLANLAAVPLAAGATIVGLVAAVAGAAADAAGSALLNATWPLLLALRAVVAGVAALPGAVIHLPAPSGPAIACYALGLGLGLAWWHTRLERPRAGRRLRRASLAALAASVALGAWPLVRPPDGRLRVAILDVGQGDAIVVRAPDGQVLLVDAGPGGPYRLDTGERVVAPILWNGGVRRLAAAVITHADGDHAGGMGFVLRHFRAAEVWTPDTAPPGRRWLGGVSVLPLRVPPADARPASRNEDGLVLRIDHGLASFLLAADVGVPTEARLVEAGAPLAATVLKVGHHGSRGSSSAAFLDAVGPRLAVISVGARNRYRHPSPEVLDRLARAGADVLRTDRDGAVILETDGALLTVTRWATGTTRQFCLDPDACGTRPARP